MKEKSGSDTQVVLISALFIFGLYALGLFFPDQFWAFHFPAFLPDATGEILLIACVILTVYAHKKGLLNSWNVEVKKEKDSLLRYGLPILAVIFFYQFPMYADIYGDAHFLVPDPNSYMEVLDPKYTDKLLSFDLLDPKIGSATITGLIATMSYGLVMTIGESFRFFDAVCGGLYVFFMLGLIMRASTVRLRRLLMVLLVIGTPLIQVFCGHFEVYAPVYALIAGFWFFVARFYEKPGRARLLLVFLMVLINIKFHITGWILLPVALLVLFNHFRVSKGNPGLKWGTVVKYVLLPLYLIGILVYVFVTKSVFGKRQYTSDTIYDVLFLPVSGSDPAPLDRYNLFSPSHFFDYFSSWFMWSASAIFILLVLLIAYRKKINWSHPILILSGTLLLLYLPFFFVLNPLYSMPADWDLIGIPGITLLVFAMHALGAFEEEAGKQPIMARMLAPLLGFTIIALTFVMVNSNRNMQAERFVSMGKYQFKTYWIGTSSYIMSGVFQFETNEEKSRIHQQVVEDLRPYACKGNDPEYAEIIVQLSIYFREVKLDFNKAIELLEEAHDYAPLLRNTTYQLVLTYYKKGDYKRAMEYVPMLVKMEYPNPDKALRVAIHTAIQAEAYGEAENYCEKFLELWPEDEFINEVYHQLRTVEDKRSILELFHQS